jgi:hypothetical protein
MKKLKAKTRLVAGVGINDVDQVTNFGKDENGREIRDDLYMRWKGLLSRCYNPKVYAHKVNARYEFCTVDERWYKFSVFKEWMESHDNWQNLQLDKDLLVPGNTVYGPDTCCLLPKKINQILVDQATHPRALKGVVIRGHLIYAATRVSDGTVKYVKCTTEEEAHKIYKKSKFDRIMELSPMVEDVNTKNALIDYARCKYGNEGS